jgi:eukaryotic-like serine/threonine-protein kinase
MPEALTAGVLFAGRFELQATLGRGGMATVYRAWDRVGQRPCAVKVLSELLSEDEQFRRRFRQEATAARGLTHPNIVSVDDWGEAGSHHYIVMEYVAGGTLRDLLRRHGRLPQALALRMAVEVADALAHAHARGVVHRDIKPENLLLAEDGRIKVADFGIARTIDAAALTRTGIVMGSARYLSPEQARGHSAGPRSDLYALGVVLFEMLAGRVPFDGDTAVAIAVQHVHEPPPRLQELRPDVPEAVAASVERLLAKQEEDRYPTAGAAAADLRRLRALLPGGVEERSRFSDAPLRGPRVATETAPVDIPTRPSPTISRTMPLAVRVGPGDATAALPATDAVGIDLPNVAHSEPPVTDIERPGAARIPPRGDAPPARRPPMDVRATAVVALLVTLAVIMGARGYRIGQPRVVVPSLIGQSVIAASEAVRTMGLRVVVAARRQDAKIPAGMIVTQDPPPGGRAGQESVVRVVVSQGSGIVPDLRGLQFDEAARRVQVAGLRLRRMAAIGGPGTDENGSEGSTIVFQLQAPGTQLASDATVDVVLAARFKRSPSPVAPIPGREKDGNREKD